jgi:hypothetical protein
MSIPLFNKFVDLLKPHIMVHKRHLPDSIQGGPDITCQKNSGSLEGSNKSKKPLFIRSKIMGIN